MRLAMALTIVLFIIGTYLNQASCRPGAYKHTNVGIIGGHQIHIEGAPYMASLRLNGTYHWCGASIIHEQFILTAAHCIVTNREYKVLVGTDNVDRGGELHDIERIIIHEDYNTETQDYDVCLLKLKKPLTFGPKLGKIDLANGNDKIPKEAQFNATGWGSSAFRLVPGAKVAIQCGNAASVYVCTRSRERPNVDVSTKLLQVQLPLFNKKRCKLLYGMYKHVITTHMICAGNLGHDSCQGDSGGPLTHGNVQVGVTSFGLQCGGIMPGVYVKVSSIYGWITDKINLLH